MFICNNCLQKHFKNYPQYSRIERCDMCKKHSVSCSRIPTNKLAPSRIDAAVVKLAGQPLYDYDKDGHARDFFDKQCEQLFQLGFKWMEYAGSFWLDGIYSIYWEQVNNADTPEKWQSHIDSINDAIERKNQSK